MIHILNISAAARIRATIWVVLAVILLAGIVSFAIYSRDKARLRYKEQLDAAMQPVIDALDECRGWDGRATLPAEFSEVQKESPTLVLPRNNVTGKQMRCIALADAPSPGDFSYFRADLTYPSINAQGEHVRVTTSSGYYLTVYGSAQQPLVDAKRLTCWVGSCAVRELKRLHVSWIRFSQFVEQDCLADIQPLTEIMAQDASKR